MQSQQFNDEQNFSNEEESTIDFRYILYLLMQKWWIIAVCMILIGSVAAVISYWYLKPQYSASATMYVYRKGDSNNGMINELYAGSQLVKDSVVLLKSDAVLSRAILIAGSDVTPPQLAGSITSNVEKETRILKITVTDGNPEMAAKLTNAITDSFLEVFKNLTQSNSRYASSNDDYINIVDKAYPNDVPVKPDKKMNILVGLFIGGAIGVGIIFLMEFFDDTIKTPEVVRLHYKLDVLGAIPMFEQK